MKGFKLVGEIDKYTNQWLTEYNHSAQALPFAKSNHFFATKHMYRH